MIEIITKHVCELLTDKNHSVTAETVLIGDHKVLDSLGLVELCLRLEDEANNLGVDFDWTSDTAMSGNRSMFRSIASLAAEFESQRQAKE